MITWTLKPWRSIGIAVAVAGLAACGQPAATDDGVVSSRAGEDGEAGENGEAGESGDDSGGERGESGERGEGGNSGPG